MLIEFSEIETETIKPKKFPSLYKSIYTGTIVLFVDSMKGIKIDNNFNAIIEDWISCDDNKTWSRMPRGSQVTFTQE